MIISNSYLLLYWIEPDFLEILSLGIMKNKSQISVVQIEKVRIFSEIDYNTIYDDNWIIYNRKDAMRVLFDSKEIAYSAVNKLYCAHLFNDIEFPEGKLMEDKATIYKIIHQVDSVSVNKSKKYHYFLRDNSIIRKEFNEKNFDSFEIHEEIIKFIDINYLELKSLIRARYAYSALRMLLTILSSSQKKDEDILRCVLVIKRNIKFLLFEKKIGILIKFVSFNIIIFPYFLKKIFNNKLVKKLIKKIEIS